MGGSYVFFHRDCKKNIDICRESVWHDSGEDVSNDCSVLRERIQTPKGRHCLRLEKQKERKRTCFLPQSLRARDRKGTTPAKSSPSRDTSPFRRESPFYIDTNQMTRPHGQDWINRAKALLSTRILSEGSNQRDNATNEDTRPHQHIRPG